MVYTMAEALRTNFLGNSPSWYKLTIIGFLIINPIIATPVNAIEISTATMDHVFILPVSIVSYLLSNRRTNVRSAYRKSAEKGRF